MASIVDGVDRPHLFITTKAPRYLPEGLRKIVLNGDDLRTTAALMDAFAAGFGFPDYFGRNWNALHDCLVDLDWLPPNGYVLVIMEANVILADEPLHPEFEQPSELAVLLDTLCRAAEEWNAAVTEGQPWDRPAVPFHVVLEVASDRVGMLQHRIAAAQREIPLRESV
jgi:hypothetical protein